MTKRRRIIRKLRINEISAVDKPAQHGATAVIMKSDVGPVVVLTSADRGHAHSVEILLNDKGGQTSFGRNPEDDQGHSHPWNFDADGGITVGMDAGHDHIVDADEVAAAFMAIGEERLRAVVGDTLAEMFKRRASKRELELALADAKATKGDQEMTDFTKAVGTLDEALESIAKSKMRDGETKEAAYDRLLQSDPAFQNLLKCRQMSQDMATGSNRPHHPTAMEKQAQATIAKIDQDLASLAKTHAAKHGVTYEQAYDTVIQQGEGAQLYAKYVQASG